MLSLLVALVGAVDDPLARALERLGDPDPAVRIAAERALPLLGALRLPTLKAAAKAADPEVRGRLLAVVERLEARGACRLLVLGDVEVRLAAVRLTRDFFPPGRTLSPDTGSAMTADLGVSIRNRGTAGVRVLLSSAVLVSEEGRAGLKLEQAVELKPGEAKELRLGGDEGPRWRPGGPSDLHLKVRAGDLAGRLAARKVKIGMSS